MESQPVASGLSVPESARPGPPAAEPPDLPVAGGSPLHSALSEALSALAPVMILSGRHADRWAEANARFLEFTGVDAADPADRSWSRVVRADAAERISLLLQDLRGDGRASRELQVSLLDRDGSYRRCTLRACRPGTLPGVWFVAIEDVHRAQWAARRVVQLREALRASFAEREALVRQLITGQEEERARVAAELHDTLGQSLTALRMAFSGGRRRHRTEAEDSALEALLQETEAQIDHMSLSLRPYLLEVEGLRAGLAAYVADWSRQHGVEAHFEVADTFPRRVPAHIEIGIYRIVLAALNNVARHARASEVNVVLGSTPATLYAIVEDDGEGFDVAAVLHAAQPRRRSGSLIMEQRARLLGGTCAWESTAGRGTSVYIRIPHESPRGRRAAPPACES